MLFSIPKAERKLIFITNEELNNPVRTRSHEKTTEAGRNFTSSSQQEAGRKAAVESIIRRQQAHTTGGVLESADALSPRTAQRPIRTREQSMAVSAPDSTAQQEAARKAAVQNLVRQRQARKQDTLRIPNRQGVLHPGGRECSSSSTGPHRTVCRTMLGLWRRWRMGWRKINDTSSSHLLVLLKWQRMRKSQVLFPALSMVQ